MTRAYKRSEVRIPPPTCGLNVSLYQFGVRTGSLAGSWSRRLDSLNDVTCEVEALQRHVGGSPASFACVVLPFLNSLDYAQQVCCTRPQTLKVGRGGQPFYAHQTRLVDRARPSVHVLSPRPAVRHVRYASTVARNSCATAAASPRVRTLRVTPDTVERPPPRSEGSPVEASKPPRFVDTLPSIPRQPAVDAAVEALAVPAALPSTGSPLPSVGPVGAKSESRRANAAATIESHRDDGEAVHVEAGGDASGHQRSTEERWDVVRKHVFKPKRKLTAFQSVANIAFRSVVRKKKRRKKVEISTEPTVDMSETKTAIIDLLKECADLPDVDVRILEEAFKKRAGVGGIALSVVEGVLADTEAALTLLAQNGEHHAPVHAAAAGEVRSFLLDKAREDNTKITEESVLVDWDDFLLAVVDVLGHSPEMKRSQSLIGKMKTVQHLLHDLEDVDDHNDDFASAMGLSGENLFDSPFGEMESSVDEEDVWDEDMLEEGEADEQFMLMRMASQLPVFSPESALSPPSPRASPSRGSTNSLSPNVLVP